MFEYHGLAHTLNGGLFLHLAGMPNHRGTHGDRIVQLFGAVAVIGPGSDGLLYVHDDEDQAGQHNAYRDRATRGSRRSSAAGVGTATAGR